MPAEQSECVTQFVLDALSASGEARRIEEEAARERFKNFIELELRSKPFV